jgi:hypothetical protein
MARTILFLPLGRTAFVGGTALHGAESVESRFGFQAGVLVMVERCQPLRNETQYSTGYRLLQGAGSKISFQREVKGQEADSKAPELPEPPRNGSSVLPDSRHTCIKFLRRKAGIEAYDTKQYAGNRSDPTHRGAS